ncbi:MAG TPA: hypothetical protein VF668_01325 [Pyrinomonadaceae bacterium]|jgi:hypothetical protein
MRSETESNTERTQPASINFRHPDEALSLGRDDLKNLRVLLRTIADTAGREAASEEALDVCGRYAARALALVESKAAERNLDRVSKIDTINPAAAETHLTDERGDES